MKWTKDKNGCWLWTGYIKSNGYGTASVKRRTVSAHRFVYQLLKGTIPKGCDLHHTCEVRHCVNPAHLEPMTRKDHMALTATNPCTINANKSECSNGHLFEHYGRLRIRANGTSERECLECKRIRRRAYNKRKRERS